FSMAPIAAATALNFSVILLTFPPEWPRAMRPGNLLAARPRARDGCWEPPALRGPAAGGPGTGTALPPARVSPRCAGDPRGRRWSGRASAPGRAPAPKAAGSPSPQPAWSAPRSRADRAREAAGRAIARSRTRPGDRGSAAAAGRGLSPPAPAPAP